MEIHEVAESHLSQWQLLRQKLWPPLESDDFELEMKEILESPRMMAFLVYEDGAYVGFAEIAIRDYADGCLTRNVGYLEGIYLEPAFRKRGFAKALINKAEDWFLKQGCTEVASDANLSNLESIRFHKSVGFTGLEPVVQFVKKLNQ